MIFQKCSSVNSTFKISPSPSGYKVFGSVSMTIKAQKFLCPYLFLLIFYPSSRCSVGETCNLLERSASEAAVQCGEEAASSKVHMHVKPWEFLQTLFYVKPVSKCDVFKINVVKAEFCVRSDIKIDVFAPNLRLSLLLRTCIRVTNVSPRVTMCALLLFRWM